MDVEAEIVELKRRVGDLEGAVRVLASQTVSVQPDITAITTGTYKRLDDVAVMIDRVVNRLDSVNTQVWSLRDDLPDLMANAIVLSRKKLG